MLPKSSLAAALFNIRPCPFFGVLHRAMNYTYIHGRTHPSLLHCDGAPRVGARFTPLGGMRSLYLAEDGETAYAEANQINTITRARNPGGVIMPAPTVLLSVKSSMESVLDLTIPAVQQALSTNSKELKAPWRLIQARGGTAPTQELGDIVFATGLFQAIRYPSSKVSGRSCFAIFCDLIVSPSYIEVYDPHGNLKEGIP